MRAYTYLVVIIIISFLISLNTIKVFSLEEMSLFLTVVGLIYGLIAAFTINNAWERFSKIRDAVAEETNSLVTMYIFAKQLSDKVAFKKLKETLLEYSQEIPTIEWHEYWASEKTHKKFRNLIKIVSEIKLKNQKDIELFDEVGEELRDAAAARNAQLVLAQTRVPKLQWALNILLSAILIIGLVLVAIPNYVLSIFIVSAMVAAVLMIFVVIYELDSMKMAEEEISNEPYRQVTRIIKSE